MHSRMIQLFMVLAFFTTCQDNEQKPDEMNIYHHPPDSNLVMLEFKMDVNRDVYDYTTYGEAPQIAIWLEHPDSGHIRTVWVSNRSGRNQWKGKVECPVALPYWESKHRFEKSEFGERNLVERLIDSITGATPTGGEFRTSIHVPLNSQWKYYIEVNASGDYNRYFPYWSKDGLPDSEGNGQPSIVYHGMISGESGNISEPQLAGRSMQRQPVDSLITDLDGITTAGDLLSGIEVLCR